MVESNQPASFTATAYRWICRADGSSKGVGSSDFPYDFVIDIIFLNLAAAYRVQRQESTGRGDKKKSLPGYVPWH